MGRRRRNAAPREACPDCGTVCGRHSKGFRRMRHLTSDGPCLLKVFWSKFYCSLCGKHFTVTQSAKGDRMPLYSRYTTSIMSAVRMLRNAGLSYDKIGHRLKVPITTVADLVNR